MQDSTFQDRQTVYIESANRRAPSLAWLDAFLRRLLDIGVALLGLLVSAPAFAVIAIAIRRDSPGPVFYRGRRMGRGGKEFNILKFRTMYERESSHNGARVTAQDDPRITPLGKWLRDTKANELPQLWNVLVGEMSLVGPRPEDPGIARTWPEEDRRVLLSVRPGITSPATVVYRDEESMLSTANVMQDYVKEILPSKLRLDTRYVRNRTITTDLDVIFWTAVALLPNMRRISIPGHLLYWGPISRLSGRYISWLVADASIALGAIAISGVIWRISRPLDIGLGKATLYALCISALFSFTNWILGLHKVEWTRAHAGEAITLGISTVLATLAILYLNTLNFLSAPSPLPVAVILVSSLLALFGFVSVRYRERLITGVATRWLELRGGVRGVGERVLIVGAGENGALASWLFERSDFRNAVNVVGYVDDDPRKQGLRMDGYDMLGMTASIPELVRKHDIGLIIYTIDNIHPQQRSRILSLCRSTGVKVVVLPDILAILKNEFSSIPKSENGELTGSHNDTVDSLLDDIQELLAENKLEAAKERITAYRQDSSEPVH